MRIYNYSVALRIFAVPLIIVQISVSFIMIYFAVVNFSIDFFWRLGLVTGPLLLAHAVLSLRDGFCQFVIDERGVTSRFLLRDIFIPWGEIKDIGVGERHYRGNYYLFLYFSKVLREKVHFTAPGQIMRQTGKCFFILYKEGLLEEVLKYVDKERIKDIEEIRSHHSPHKMQYYSTSNSMLKREKSGRQ